MLLMLWSPTTVRLLQSVWDHFLRWTSLVSILRLLILVLWSFYIIFDGRLFTVMCFDILIIFDHSLRSVCAGIVTKKVIYYTCITFLKSNRGCYCLKILHYFALICNMTCYQLVQYNPEATVPHTSTDSYPNDVIIF